MFYLAAGSDLYSHLYVKHISSGEGPLSPPSGDLGGCLKCGEMPDRAEGAERKL
jgi:hypothetical protein